MKKIMKILKEIEEYFCDNSNKQSCNRKISDNLYKLRLNANLSEKQLAEKMNTSTEKITYIENIPDQMHKSDDVYFYLENVITDDLKIVLKLIAALNFYANPLTYTAIGFFPDSPCGEFIEDFDELNKPGALARKTLSELLGEE